MFDTNVTGLINMTQAILPIFKSRPDGGRGDIINIGSVAGRESYPGGSIYCATKAAVRSFTDSLRRELIATRIRVMEIDPGQVETVSQQDTSTAAEIHVAVRNFPSSGFTETKRRQMRCIGERRRNMRRCGGYEIDSLSSGCEPLTPEDIAEGIPQSSGMSDVYCSDHWLRLG